MTDPTAVRFNGKAAVVVGASMAGLCAARVLADRFDRVIVLDRDDLPEGAAHRRLVPQGRHPHLLLKAGQRLLEGWFPGLTDELVGQGAVEVDISADVHWYDSGGVARRPPSPLVSPAMSRPLLEHTVRQRVVGLDNVELSGDTAVVGMEMDPSRQRVTGVRLDDGALVAGDLVVDSTGRQARSAGWLEEFGYDAPATSMVHVDTRYVSRLYRRGDAPHRDWKAAAVFGEPESKRQAMALPIEDDQWIVVLIGVNGESPPTDDQGMLGYVSSLDSPVIAQVIASSEPLTDPVTHRFPTNQRRHVEKLRNFPLGWVPLGDAVCSFNPIYGQGMTSAAQQADALGAALDRSGAVDRRFARRYFRAASRIVSVPWSTAVGGDFAFPDTRGEKPFGTDLLNRYTRRVLVAGQHDDLAVLRFNDVVSMVRRPETLLTPGFALRVFRASARGPVGLSEGEQPGTGRAPARSGGGSVRSG